MLKLYITILILLISARSFSQDIAWFPSELNIKPFTANFLEPKLGFLFELNQNQLRLDISNSLDVYHNRPSENTTFSFGADLFTYTLLRSEENFHFPVDAVDYLFGLNFGLKKKYDNMNYGVRFRISHISAHAVDGHYDFTNQKWLNGQTPKIYSREFIELAPFYSINDLRVYAVITYIFHTDPITVGKDNYQIGAEYFLKNIISENYTPFIAYDAKLINLNKYSLNN